MSVSNIRTPNGHWKCCQWRQSGGLEVNWSLKMKKWKFSDHKTHQFRRFHFRFRATVNPLLPGHQRFASLMAVPVVQIIMQHGYVFINVTFLKKNGILLKFQRQNNCYTAGHLLKESYHFIIGNGLVSHSINCCQYKG